MGAWIEILNLIRVFEEPLVAPHVGAWIEMLDLSQVAQLAMVAPHVGAWIEIDWLCVYLLYS